MSYQSAKRETLSKDKGVFSGGFVDNVDNLDLAPHYSPYLRNIRLDGQSPIIRPGHTLFAELTAGSYPKGIGTYLVTGGNKLVVRHNTDSTHKLYTIVSDATATSIDTGANIASDNRMNFTNVGDVVYCMNGSDDYGKLSGTTYSTPSTGIASFAPSFSVVFNSSHRASGRSTNPNKVYKSVGDNYEDFNSTGSDNFTFPEKITGLCANKESLFYFTQNTISVTDAGDIQDVGGSLAYNTRPLATKDGSMWHNTIVAAGSDVYYLSSSNSINVIARGANVSGFDVISISDREYEGISKIMATLDNNQDDAFGYFLPKEMIIKWFVKTQGSEINDLCIVYDIEHKAFLIDDAKYFYGGVFLDGVNYTISTVEPKVFKDETAQDDDDSPIQWEYRTKEFYISDPTVNKKLRESRTLLDVNELAQVTQSIYLDGVERDSKTIYGTDIVSNEGGIGTDEIGDFEIGGEGSDESDYTETYILRTKGNLGQTKQYQKIQRRFTGGTVGEKVRLKNLTAKIEIMPEIATNLTP